MELENYICELRIQIQELKDKVQAMRISPSKTFQTLHVDNWLRKFEELMLDNALLKIQNQT